MTEHQLRNHLQTALSDPSPLVIPVPREVVEALVDLLNEKSGRARALESYFQQMKQIIEEAGG